MIKLLGLFILVPVAELFLLIELGKQIGVLWTLVLIAFTGVLGAWLARRQGLSVLERVREDLAAGQMPTTAAADGILILVAGAVLMTPGVLTDAFGFFCLSPWGRTVVKKLVTRWFRQAVSSGSVRVTMVADSVVGSRSREVRDITPPSERDNNNRESGDEPPAPLSRDRQDLRAQAVRDRGKDRHT